MVKKPLKKYLTIIVKLLFVLYNPYQIIITMEFLKPQDPFLPHFRDNVKFDVYFLYYI